MDESFASLAIIELPGGPVGAHAGQRGHVEHPPKSAIVAFRPVQVPADAAGIPWHRHQSGVGRQSAGGTKDVRSPPGDHQRIPRRGRVRTRAHPIHHQVAGLSSVDPDQAGRRHAPTNGSPTKPSRTAVHDLNPSPASSTRKYSVDPCAYQGGSSSLCGGRATSTRTAVHRDHGTGDDETEQRGTTIGSSTLRGSTTQIRSLGGC